MFKHYSQAIFLDNIKPPILLFLLFLTIAFGCNTADNKDIILKVGSYSLASAEFEKVKSDNKKNTRLNNAQLQNKLIDEGYILAYALEHRFDTISLLKKQLEYASRLWVSEVDGFVWNKKVKPLLKVSKEDVQIAYSKSGTDFELESIHFTDREVLHKWINSGNKQLSVLEFNLLKEKIAGESGVKYTKFSQPYPLIPLSIYFDSLPEAKVGDVFGPVESLNGYLIVHVAEKKKVPQPARDVELSRLESELLNGLKEKYIWESQKDIFNKADPEFNHDAIKTLASACDRDKREWPGVDPGMVLMHYTFEGNRKPYLASDFFEFVKCEPVFYGSLSDADDVKAMLKSQIIGIYLFADAKKLNVETDTAYLVFRKLFLNKLYISHYKQQQLPQPILFEDDYKRYYKENLNSFKSIKSANVSAFIFKDMQTAYEALRSVREYFDKNSEKVFPDEMLGLLGYKEKMVVSLSDSAYNPSLLRTLSRLEENQLSSPFPVKDEVWVVYLWKKEGTATLPYNLVKSEIKNPLTQRKMQEALDHSINRLKTVYPVEINRLDEVL